MTREEKNIADYVCRFFSVVNAEKQDDGSFLIETGYGDDPEYNDYIDRQTTKLMRAWPELSLISWSSEAVHIAVPAS